MSYITISHNGELLLAIDHSSVVSLISLETKEVFTISKGYSENRWTHAVFDRNDENIIFGSSLAPSCRLNIYNVERLIMINQLLGPTDPVKALFCHPLRPVCYVLGAQSVRIWTPTFLNHPSIFLPGFDELTSNEKYFERESEFDEEEVKPEIFNNTQNEIIDVLNSPPSFYIESDVNFLNQLIKLPFNLNNNNVQ